MEKQADFDDERVVFSYNTYLTVRSCQLRYDLKGILKNDLKSGFAGDFDDDLGDATD